MTITVVAMTGMIKAELCRVECAQLAERKAEVAALLRFAGGLHIAAGRVVVQAELDTGSAARRLHREITEVYGYTSAVIVVGDDRRRRGVRYLVRVASHGEDLARRAGLIDRRGRPIHGLPPAVVAGDLGVAAAAWRGAFLARGAFTEPGASARVEISCPTLEAGVALVGAARRLGVLAKAREVVGADRVLAGVVIRGDDAISALLTGLGAHESVLAWTERRLRQHVRADAQRVANFDEANLRRAARAAATARSRVQRALDILAGEAPEHLLAAGRLRLHHPHASLEELGKQADPPITKDAVAGRIRRLLTMADEVAHSLNIPDTGSAVGEDIDFH